MAAALKEYPRDAAAPYLAEGTTFRVMVSSIGNKKISDDNRMDVIRRLEHLLPWKGKVRMKGCEHTFVVFIDAAALSGTDGATPGAMAPALITSERSSTMAAIPSDRQ